MNILNILRIIKGRRGDGETGDKKGENLFYIRRSLKNRLHLYIKMTDFNSILLSQITDLQTRLSKQEVTISALKNQLERFGNNTPPMRMSFPLHTDRPPRSREPRAPRNTPNTRDTRVPRSSTPYPTIGLSDVIQPNEHVTIQIKTGLTDGVQEYTTALAVFDGTNLKVTECDLAESLVGMTSSKPGEILYRFMESLKESGHIKNTFGIAPWRLCFVERNGVRVSLEELRNTVG